jgi:uncharacterized protein YqhQ
VPKGEYLQYGGQAIVEGVMMRSPKHFAVAVRAPNGEIVLKTEALEKTWIGRQKWLKWPFLRGTLALIDAMALGYKALKFSANIQLDERYQPKDPEGAKTAETLEGGSEQPDLPGVAVASAPTESGNGAADAAVMPKEGDSVNSVQVGAALIVGLMIGLFLFVYLPNLVAELGGPGLTSTMKNLVTGLVKIVFFLAYIWGIGFMPEIRRLFRYHGAEHKAINTLEDGRELTIENCKLNTRLHPRCGTSFAIVVLLVSLIVFTYVPRYPLGESHLAIINVTIRFAMEIVILPLIAGISYEMIRLAGKLRASALMKAMFMPGLWTQYLTTGEPDEEMTEVALTALKACVDAEENGLPASPEAA